MQAWVHCAHFFCLGYGFRLSCRALWKYVLWRDVITPQDTLLIGKSLVAIIHVRVRFTGFHANDIIRICEPPGLNWSIVQTLLPRNSGNLAVTIMYAPYISPIRCATKMGQSLHYTSVIHQRQLWLNRLAICLKSENFPNARKCRNVWSWTKPYCPLE